MHIIENKELELKLKQCSKELDQCALLIKDHDVEPVKDNIKKIANAIAEISDILILFESVQKELKKPWRHKCSFCKQSEDQVDILIQGPGVFICKECIDICQNIINEKESSEQ